MKQVCSCAPCSPLKLLYVQFLAETVQVFACKTSFTTEAIGLAVSQGVIPSEKEKKVVSTAICPMLLLLPPTSLGKIACIALPKF